MTIRTTHAIKTKKDAEEIKDVIREVALALGNDEAYKDAVAAMKAIDQEAAAISKADTKVRR